MRFIAKIIAVGIIVCSSCIARAESISVSAAISLKEVLGDIAKQYEADTQNHVDLNLGASGTLAVQIEHGAPVDLFISAGKKQVDQLIADGFTDGGTPVNLAGNQLVVVVPSKEQSPPARLEDLAEQRFAHIAIGEPKSVPAGQYAMQTLKALHLDTTLAGKLIMGENVRQVLIYVSRGEADAGLVYATDAKEAGDTVNMAFVVPAETHDPIVYPAVIIKTGHHETAELFLKYIQDKGAGIFAAHGFSPPPAATQPSNP